MARSVIALVTPWRRAVSRLRGVAVKVVLAVTLALVFLPGSALVAQEPVHMDIRLMAGDLVDEMVFAWTKSPPLPEARAVMLASVVAPIGLDERFTVFVENRLFELLRVHPDLPVTLSYCSICNRLVVKSTPHSTYLGRGIDQPEVLSNLLQTAPDRLGLAMHFEAEGRDLVLRAQIFELKGMQKVVWAQSFTTSMAARRVLREASPLISLEQAREQQRALLERRDPLELTTRLTVRSFNFEGGTAGLEVSQNVPMIFLEQAFEGVLYPGRRRRIGAVVGFTSIRNSMEGWSAGGRFAQLLSSDEPRLAEPDLYVLLGFHYLRLRGGGALPFGAKQLDLERILNERDEPRASLLAWRLGLEAHIKHRYGALAFMEYVPTLNDNESFATERLLGVPYHNLGVGLVVRW